MLKYTNKEYIEKAKEIHGNEFDYTQTKYTGTGNKITVICRKHGAFKVTANSHLSGHKCKKCTTEIHASSTRYTMETFIAKARVVHGTKYLYSKSQPWVGSKSKIKIKCKVHGMFYQTPSNHLYGYGCKLCCNSERDYSITSFSEQLKKIKEIQGTKYDYTELKAFVKSNSYHGKTKVPIKCPKHGMFYQTISNHVSGKGCAKCGRESAAQIFNTGFAKSKDYRFGKRIVKVQGYENFGLDWLVKTKNINPDDVIVSMEKGAKVIRYSKPETHKQGFYHPDFYLPKLNRLIEVKSIWTLLRHFDTNVAKAKACLEQGYNFTMLVLKPNGEQITLPKNWMELNAFNLKQAIEQAAQF